MHLLSAHDGCDVHRDVRSRWAEHYILKGVTDALFLVIRNLGTFELAIKNIADVTPRGVVYTLRSVLRGSSILNAHFTGVLYSP